MREQADEALERLGLADVADRPAGGLPYGTLKRVEIARALCQQPRLLMLDEPASGLSHEEVDELGGLIVSLRDDLDLTVLLVEHHMGMVMRISDTVVVLEFGRKIADGPPARGPGGRARHRGLPGGERVSLLEVSDLEAGYGPVTVLRGISFSVDEGRIVTVLGPNGAGKTTTLRALSGMVRRAGEIRFDGKDVSGYSPEKMARQSVAHVPEGRGTFTGLTVEENLRVGAYPRRDKRRRSRRTCKRCFGYFPRLEERRAQHAGSLSGGEQQMLAIARALMLRPRLMLLDEPSLGLAPKLTRELFEILEKIAREEGVTLLLVEQNANLVLKFADDAYVLEAGRIVLSGTAKEIEADEGIRRSYLGF